MRRLTIREIRAKDNKLYYDISYRMARRNVLKRDKYKCIIKNCVKPFKKITVHHVRPRSRYMQLACNEDNMVTLCRKHHDEVEKGKHKTEVHFYAYKLKI